MATGRYKAMKARIAAAVARKAKMEGAQQRAVEERRKADERHAALESKHEAKRRLAEEAKERKVQMETHSFLSQADVPSSSQQGLQEPKNQGLGVKSKVKVHTCLSEPSRI